MIKDNNTDLGLLILRVSLGIVFLAHGYLKVFVFGLDRGYGVFEAHTVWHINMIPGWFIYPAALIEWVGGFMLIFGYKIRIAALATAAVAFGAGAVHFENGWNYTSKPDGGWEYGIFLCVCCLVVYLLGAGRYSLDKK
ncbi:DoxX family protein [Arenicella sp.]|nr:DoxX family protein [Arenicella sp.]